MARSTNHIREASPASQMSVRKLPDGVVRTVGVCVAALGVGAGDGSGVGVADGAGAGAGIGLGVGLGVGKTTLPSLLTLADTIARHVGSPGLEESIVTLIGSPAGPIAVVSTSTCICTPTGCMWRLIW